MHLNKPASSVFILFFSLLFLSCKKDQNVNTSVVSNFSIDAGKDAIVTIKGVRLLIDGMAPEVWINDKKLEVLGATGESVKVRIPKFIGSGKFILKVAGQDYDGPSFFY